MKISIAMATFNGESYLEEQLASFLSQTRLPDELVISDDTSVDKTQEIVMIFKEKAPFPVVFLTNSSRGGYSANFNNALRHTSGDLVFISDQDDVWFDRKIQVMTKLACKNPSKQVVMCNAALVDRSLQPVGLTKIEQIRSAGLLDTSYVMGNSVAVRQEFLKQILPIPDDYPSHDSWIVRMADGIDGRLLHEEVLQFYRRHEGNVSQFLPNQLTPVGRWEVLKRKGRAIREVFDGTYLVRQQQALKEAKLFLLGISRARSRSSRSEEKWAKFMREKQALTTILRQRLSWMEEPKLRRCRRIFRAWRRGDYCQFQGVITAACDLLANTKRNFDDIDHASST